MTGPTLDLFTLFHLNLAFSSIEEESRAGVIERAYWPALAFADAHGPIGIEATGDTLEEIAAREPAWIALLWTNTVAFQKLQRLAHGDIELEDYLAFVAGHRAPTPRALCLYASDAEIFDFRPGRYRTEEAIAAPSEWNRLHDAFAALEKLESTRLVAPSAALSLAAPAAGQTLRLET